MKFIKKIVRAGVHHPKPGQTVEVSPERLKHWADTAQAMLADGLLIPAPYYHNAEIGPVRDRGTIQDAHAKDNAGFWTRIFIDDDGWLAGELEAATAEDASRIGTAARGCSLLAPEKFVENGKVWDDAITHIALTNKPVVKAPDNFQAIALSADTLAVDPTAAAEPQGDEPESQGGDCATACSLLAELGLQLPEGTTDENFLERLITAATAVLSFKRQEGADVTQPPKGAKEQKPAPVAMSHELELACELLTAANATNPETQQPWTLDQLKAAAEARKPQPAALSAEQQAALNWATDHARGDYKARIEGAVKRGQVTPQYATGVLAPLLANLEVRFSADGKRVETELDRILAAVEAIPANAVLTGQSPTGYQKARRVGDAVFALDLTPPGEPKVEPMPAAVAGFDDSTPLDAATVEETWALQKQALGLK